MEAGHRTSHRHRDELDVPDDVAFALLLQRVTPKIR